MTLPELQSCLHRLGVNLTAVGDKLRVDAPGGVLTADIKAALVAHKPTLLSMLARADAYAFNAQSPVAVGDPEPPTAVADAAVRSDPSIPAATPETADPAPAAVLDGRLVAPRRRLAAVSPRLSLRLDGTLDPDRDVTDHPPPTEHAVSLKDADPAVAPIEDKPEPTPTGPRDVRRGDTWLPWHFPPGIDPRT